MQRPNPELINEENPEWSEEDFANSVPFSALPAELQALLSEPKKTAPDADSNTSKPAA
jgi:hypothetical protein